MRRFLLYLFVGIFCALLQSSLFPLLLPTGLRPNLLLILILYLGLSENFTRAVIIALLLGGIQDSFSGTNLGLYVTVDLAVLLLVRLLSVRLNTENPVLLLLLIAAGTLVQNFLVGFCLMLFRRCWANSFHPAAGLAATVVGQSSRRRAYALSVVAPSALIRQPYRNARPDLPE